jgi:hypothetical protein
VIRSTSLMSGPFTDFPVRFRDTQTGARIARNVDKKPRFPAGGGAILSRKPRDFMVSEKRD